MQLDNIFKNLSFNIDLIYFKKYSLVKWLIIKLPKLNLHRTSIEK